MTPVELRNALDRLGWTYQRLADEVGKSRRMAIYWVKGHSPVPKYVAVIVRYALEKQP